MQKTDVMLRTKLNLSSLVLDQLIAMHLYRQTALTLSDFCLE